MATLLLMVAMTLTVRVLGWVGQERRSTERRQRAVLEVANAMERIAAHEFDQVSLALVQQITAKSEAAKSLPDAEWTAQVVEAKGVQDLPSKRVSLSLRWKNRQQDWESPVRLTTWIERRRTRP